MLRVLARALGAIALAGAYVAALVDGARSIADDAVTLTPAGAALAALAPAAFERLAGGASKIHAEVWRPVLMDALKIPTCLGLAVLGFLLVALASPPQIHRP